MITIDTPMPAIAYAENARATFIRFVMSPNAGLIAYSSAHIKTKIAKIVIVEALDPRNSLRHVELAFVCMSFLLLRSSACGTVPPPADPENLRFPDRVPSDRRRGLRTARRRRLPFPGQEMAIFIRISWFASLRSTSPLSRPSCIT